MRGYHIFDVGENALLRGAWQLADALENLTGLARWTRTAFGSDLFAEQLVGGGAEHISEFGEIIRPQGRGASFPSGVSLLGNAELLGNLYLRESGTLANRHQTLTELGTF